MATPPSNAPRTLSRAEFEQLLQRAVERHAKDGPRTFNETELVQAGGELGIDAETVRAVFREHERELTRPPARQRPFDSKLTLVRTGEGFTLSIPPRTSTRVWAVLTPTLFLGGLAAMIAAHLPLPFALGTAAVGALASYLVSRAARTVRELRLNPDGGGWLLRRRGKRERGLPLQPGQVHARLAIKEYSTQQGVVRVPFVALDHGTETHELLVNYSHAEQVWAVDEIERWLGR